MKILPALCAAALAATSAAAQPRLTQAVAGLGQQAQVAENLSIVPVAVIEDSRCPADVDCISPGRLVLVARATLSDKSEQIVLALGAAQKVGKGHLTLETVTPERRGGTISPQDYRFGFSYVPARTDSKAARAQ